MMKFNVLFICFLLFVSAVKAETPNIILMITDDQGYGDFGVTGNPVIKTPNIDAMAARSFEMTRFYVNAVCSPTRASLMTGRNSYRTGITDTFKGRSTMRTEEYTMAEMLKT
ncbi:MAG: sulfatase-like hydrolase/transferase, partial [Lentisphaeraceae bacterium]|nr:sulfatase-like hydrolase/transferase [Lentisphaeraceae bacterium]